MLNDIKSVEPVSEMLTEQVYVHCNFCNTILVVNIPCNNLFNIVTVRCEHCANFLPVNLSVQCQKLPLQDIQNHGIGYQGLHMDRGSSSNLTKIKSMKSVSQQMLHIRTAEKRRRIPSAYNRFIKEEIRRLKAANPDISHKKAFITAAKNWAHLPRIHFRLSVEGNKQV